MLTVSMIVLIVLVFCSIVWVLSYKIAWGKCIDANKERWKKDRKSLSTKSANLEKEKQKWDDEIHHYKTEMALRAYKSAKDQILETLSGHIKENIGDESGTRTSGTLTFGDMSSQSGLGTADCQAWSRLMSAMQQLERQGFGDIQSSYLQQLGLGQQSGIFSQHQILSSMWRELFGGK